MTGQTPEHPGAGPGSPVLAVGAIVVVADHILLVTRTHPPAQGLWTIPGGRVEPGEQMAQAVTREVAEETGLNVVCGAFVGWVERIGADFHFVIFDFRAHPIAEVDGRIDNLVPVAGDDAGEVGWFPLTDIESVELVPGLLDFLTDHQIVTS